MLRTGEAIFTFGIFVCSLPLLKNVENTTTFSAAGCKLYKVHPYFLRAIAGMRDAYTCGNSVVNQSEPFWRLGFPIFAKIFGAQPEGNPFYGRFRM